MILRSGISFRPPTCRHTSLPKAHIHRAALFLLAFAAVTIGQGTARAQAPPQFVYAADTNTHLIYGFQLNTTTGVLTPIQGSPFNERLAPSAMTTDPAGKFLFVANGADNDISVFQINPMTGALTEAPNSPFATGLGTNPTALTTDPAGKFLYVANQNTTDIGFSALGQGEVDVYAIDPVTGKLAPTPNSTPPNIGTSAPYNPVGVFIHPNGHWFYVQGGTGELPNNSGFAQLDQIQGYVLDPATGDVSAPIGTTNPTWSGIEGSYDLIGDPAGNYLINAFGGSCNFEATLAISQADGTLTQTSQWDGIDINLALCTHTTHATIDATRSFLFSNAGSWFLSPAGVMTTDQVVSTPTVPQGPWVADPLGPFVFASDLISLHSYSINTTTGVLTDVMGSPYSLGTSASINAIAVTGSVPLTLAPTAVFLPTSLTFMNTVVGVGASLPVQLFNSGTATLNITQISITGANMADFQQTNNCGNQLNAGANCMFTVTFTPSSSSNLETASLNVFDDAGGSPQSVSLTRPAAVSTPPFAVLNPTNLTFAQTVVNGSSSVQTFTVTNTGTQTLTISGVALAGANPGDFGQSSSCVGANLANNASCTVSVQFLPQAVGQRTALVNVSDDSNGGSPQPVMVSGSATDPFNMALSGPTSVTVPPNQPANYNLSFTPMATFSGTVTFSCAVVPAGPTCSVTPSMVQVNAAQAPMPTPVKVTATPSGAAGLGGPDWLREFFFFDTGGTRRAGALAASSRTAIWGLAFLVWLASPRARNGIASSRLVRMSGAVIMVCTVGICCAMAACGGSGGSSVGPPPPQNFMVNVTATAGQVSQTVNLSLTVQ